MGYYMGDFYMQGHGRGDPFLGALLGIGSKIFSGVRGLLGRGAVSAVPRVEGRAATGGLSEIVRAGAGRIGGAIRQHPVLTGAGAAGVLGAIGGAAGERMLAGGGCPRGHHISRSKHSMGKCVRNRRMHVTNPKALRRAIRRAEGFSRFAMRCIRLTHPRKKGRFGGFKKRTRKK